MEGDKVGGFGGAYGGIGGGGKIPAGKPGGGGYWLDRARQRTVPSLTYSMIEYDS